MLLSWDELKGSWQISTRSSNTIGGQVGSCMVLICSASLALSCWRSPTQPCYWWVILAAKHEQTQSLNGLVDSSDIDMSQIWDLSNLLEIMDLGQETNFFQCFLGVPGALVRCIEIELHRVRMTNEKVVLLFQPSRVSSVVRSLWFLATLATGRTNRLQTADPQLALVSHQHFVTKNQKEWGKNIQILGLVTRVPILLSNTHTYIYIYMYKYRKFIITNLNCWYMFTPWSPWPL